MARTISEIYDAIIADKDNQSSLTNLSPNSDDVDRLTTDLNSSSKVAIWRLFCYLIAVAHYTMEVLFDAFKFEIETIVAQAPTGTLRWYQLRMFEFQYGDTLDFVNEKFIYSIIDESKRVVKLCAVEDRPDGVLIIKVANLDSSGFPVPLGAAEKLALEGYVSKIRFAGTKYLVVSSTPDLLKVIGTVYYDPIVPLATVTQRVEEVINDYINNLPFNGVFKINGLIDAVQLVEGVVDFSTNTVEAKTGALPYGTVLRTYTARAGYLGIDPLFDLGTNLTYSPSQV